MQPLSQFQPNQEVKHYFNSIDYHALVSTEQLVKLPVISTINSLYSVKSSERQLLTELLIVTDWLTTIHLELSKGSLLNNSQLKKLSYTLASKIFDLSAITGFVNSSVNDLFESILKFLVLVLLNLISSLNSFEVSLNFAKAIKTNTNLMHDLLIFFAVAEFEHQITIDELISTKLNKLFFICNLEKFYKFNIDDFKSRVESLESNILKFATTYFARPPLSALLTLNKSLLLIINEKSLKSITKKLKDLFFNLNNFKNFTLPTTNTKYGSSPISPLLPHKNGTEVCTIVIDLDETLIHAVYVIV